MNRPLRLCRIISARYFLFLIAALLPIVVEADDINEELLTAGRKGDAEAVKALLDKGVVRLLLDRGAEAKEGALITGVELGHTEIVKAVLEKGGVGATTLSSAFEIATKSGRAEIVELLKKAGAIVPPKADFQVDPE